MEWVQLEHSRLTADVKSGSSLPFKNANLILSLVIVAFVQTKSRNSRLVQLCRIIRSNQAICCDTLGFSENEPELRRHVLQIKDEMN